ncbi:MAG: RNA 2',3'-cyclic phosphodiesterase [Candidatus Krumholzibacteriia bacterium]
MRLFVAVKVPEHLASAVDARIDGLRSRLPLAWTSRDTWHLTLQFLGEWPEERCSRLQEALLPLTEVPAFALDPDGLGQFPDRGPPRVLFLHLAAGEEAARLAGAVRETVRSVWPDGPQDTRPFRGHLTLARVKQKLERQDVKLLQEFKIGSLPQWPVGGFSLMASRLSQAGAEHRELAFYRLRK